jgi:hypothetical protein
MRRAWVMAGLWLIATAAAAEPIARERMMQLCANVEGPAHCARIIEAEQLKALPDLAKRDGDTLTVRLFPSGTRLLVDSLAANNERSYALWDYWSPINAVVLFVASGDDVSYAVLQRASGQLTALPAEPVLAPDRQRIAVADFCSSKCTNEVSVWRVARDGVRKEMTYKPPADWSDVTVAWKDGETLVLQYDPAGGGDRKSVDRRLAAGDWKRP